jgi:hypothetical protein
MALAPSATPSLTDNVEPGWQSRVGQTITKKLAEASFFKTTKRNFD